MRSSSNACHLAYRHVRSGDQVRHLKLVVRHRRNKSAIRKLASWHHWWLPNRWPPKCGHTCDPWLLLAGCTSTFVVLGYDQLWTTIAFDIQQTDDSCPVSENVRGCQGPWITDCFPTLLAHELPENSSRANIHSGSNDLQTAADVLGNDATGTWCADKQTSIFMTRAFTLLEATEACP